MSLCTLQTTPRLRLADDKVKHPLRLTCHVRQKMKKKLKLLTLLLLSISLIDGLEECGFEVDECGWYSGSDLGDGSFVRTSSEEQKNGGSDLYPSNNMEENGITLQNYR